jgi:hypothetical protein
LADVRPDPSAQQLGEARSPSVSGGASNTASGGQASVSGGSKNTASGEPSSIFGGTEPEAAGQGKALLECIWSTQSAGEQC